jgi:hypothetical protein
MNRKLVSLTVAFVLTVSSLPVLASQQPSDDGTTPPPSLIVRKAGKEQQEYVLPAGSTDDASAVGTPTPEPSIIAVL